MQGKEKWRPKQVESQLQEEYSDSQHPPLRSTRVQDLSKGEPDQDVEYRPDQAKQPAGRKPARFRQCVKPGVPKSAV